MTRPYPSHQHYEITARATRLSAEDKKLAPDFTTQTQHEILALGKTNCHFISFDEFSRDVTAWLSTTQFHHVVTLNPEMVIEAEHNPFFEKAINAASIRIPDGAGLIWARWYIRSQFWSLLASLLAFPFVKVDRIPGVDALVEICRICEQANKSIYLLGGTAQQNKLTAKYLAGRFPRLVIHAAVDHKYTKDGPAKILTDIQQKQPAVLFVAYGAPNQSIWIENHKNNFPSVRVAVGVGGAFAILAEDLPRAPLFLRRRNAEWLWRLLLQPSRLSRILQAIIKFPLLIHRQKKSGA